MERFAFDSTLADTLGFRDSDECLIVIQNAPSNVRAKLVKLIPPRAWYGAITPYGKRCSLLIFWPFPNEPLEILFGHIRRALQPDGVAWVALREGRKGLGNAVEGAQANGFRHDETIELENGDILARFRAAKL